MLKFKGGDDKHIFWLQDPSVEKDDELCRRVNEMLSSTDPTNVAPPVYGLPIRGGHGRTTATIHQMPLSSLQGLGIGNSTAAGAQQVVVMDPKQLMQYLSRNGQRAGKE